MTYKQIDPQFKAHVHWEGIISREQSAEMDFVQSLEPAITTEMQGWLDNGKTYQEISNVLQGRFPGVTRGLSERSVRHFCWTNSIQKCRGIELDSIR